MNLRQLEAFRATMRSGSITEAANILHISQPSVSRLIADLERALGFGLFARTGRGLTPTVEARTFYNGVEGMFTGIGRLEDLAASIRSAAGGEITIGTIQSIAMIELPKAVAQIYRAHPDVRFMIQSRNTPAILDAVQMQQFDLGIVGRQPPYEGVEVLFQAAAPYVCLMPEDHALVGGAGSVDLAELAAQESFVTFGGAYPDEMMAMDSTLAGLLRRSSRLSAANMPAAASLVREAGVFAVVDPFTAEQAVRMGGVAFRPVTQDLTYHVALVCHGRETLSQRAQEFAELFSDQLQQRVDEVSALRG